jgi:hypothetical protein
MNSQTMVAEGVMRKPAGQVAVRVAPPAGVDLQSIYRAGLNISWNPAKMLIEDRAAVVEGPHTSAARIARALRGELGIVLRPSGNIHWNGFSTEEQAQVASALFG